MKRVRILSGVVGIFLSLLLPVFLAGSTWAQDSEPRLLISHYKITSSNGQFIELYNDSAEPIDMSAVQLAYYNNYDVAKATSSKLVSLTGTLAPGSYYLVNDSAATLCYQTVVASASLGFSSTAGLVQVHLLAQSVPGGPISSTVVDSAAWSKTAVPGVQTLPSNVNGFLQREWQDDEPKTSGGGSWLGVQPSAANPCVYESVIPAQQESVDEFIFLPSSLPPVRFVVAPVEGGETLINRNVGKMAPVVNEVLPNPASPQTDADDEFIELYNPNDTVFDLSGFKLAFGSTSPKKYTFPEGTILQPKEFKAFTSGDTSISLSNTEAQVWLLDPNEKVIGQSDAYSKAKDGQAWALNNGTWAWTAVPTPNDMNALTGTTGGSGTAQKTSAVLGISNGSAVTAATTVASATNPSQLDDAAPLHPAILAGVGAAAVGYALYEYRHDMANRIFQLRRYFSLRRANR